MTDWPLLVPSTHYNGSSTAPIYQLLNGYKGYGKKTAVPLTGMGTLSGQNDTMNVVPTVLLSGSISPSTGYTLSNKFLWVTLGTNANISLLTDATNALNFNYNTPNISGATVLLRAAVSKATGEQVLAYKAGLMPNASGVALAVPAAP